MSLLFPDSENLDRATLVSLTKAYEAAWVELAAKHYFSSSQLAGLIDVMATAIRDLYRGGQRGQSKLTHHAVTRALGVSHGTVVFGHRGRGASV
jgi:hypothetical protein